jgi:hypothetical protein
MNRILFASFLALGSAAPKSVFSEEPLYPEGYNVLIAYEANGPIITNIDTLVITRNLVNHEQFRLTGIYFSENIPPGFELLGHSITVNGNAVSCEPDTIVNSFISGCKLYHWIVDEPGGAIQNSLNPGDSLVFRLQLICPLPGQYTLPHHTTSFYGNSTGFFSTGDSLAVSIVPVSDTIPPNRITDLGLLTD